MQVYLAIFKRDAQLQPLNIPKPVFFLMVIIILLFITNMVVTGILLFLGCWFCSTLIVSELKAAHSHELAFVLPNFKAIQFNYSLGLCSLMALTTGILLASDIGEAIFWSVLAQFCISLIFLLVNRRAIFVVISFITSVIASVVILNALDKAILIKQLIHFVRDVFALFGEHSLVAASIIFAFLSVFNLSISRRGYLNYRQYQARNFSENGQQNTASEQPNKTTIMGLFISKPLHKKVLQSKESFSNWLEYGNNPSLLAQATYDPTVKLQSLMGILSMLVYVLLLMCFLPFTTPLANMIDNFVFLVFGLLSITSIGVAVFNGFLSQQKVLSNTWLLTDVQSRQDYNKQILSIFAKRYLRAVSLVFTLLMVFGVIVLDVSRLTLLLTPLLLFTFLSAVLSSIITLQMIVRWPSSSWISKISSAVIYALYMVILNFDFSKVTNLGSITLAVASVVLVLSFIGSIRYWQKNGLQ